MSHKLIHPVASLILVPVLVFAGAFAPVFCRPETPLVFNWKAINKCE